MGYEGFAEPVVDMRARLRKTGSESQRPLRMDF